MSSGVPASFTEGLVSGLVQPVIGIEHLLFLVAAGIVSAMYARPSFTLPPAYMLAMVAGLAVNLLLFDLPQVEVVTVLTGMVFAVLILNVTILPIPLAVLLMMIAGLYHGYAFGESVRGAEPPSVAAFLLGLLIVQYSLLHLVAAAARNLSGFRRRSPLLRVAGGILLTAGAVLMVNTLAPALRI